MIVKEIHKISPHTCTVPIALNTNAIEKKIPYGQTNVYKKKSLKFK